MNSRSKKQQYKTFEEPYWDCSVCTYRNTPEAFKCLMCDIRKGTSTRKPKVNSHLAVQQYNSTLPKSRRDDERDKSSSDRKRKKFKKIWRPSKLKNVDRSTAQARDITINNITIQITEYKVKDKRSYDLFESSTSEMSSHSESGFETSSTAATHSSSKTLNSFL